MAFRPSEKRKQSNYIIDLNLAPFLSLFVALIPMLLLTAIFQEVGIINLYLPTAEEAVMEDVVPDAESDFTLAVTITPTELSLRKDDQVLFRDSIAEEMNLQGLTAQLVELKGSSPGKKDIVLLLDGSILYQTIIDVMDSVREYEGGELYPDISLADRVVETS